MKTQRGLLLVLLLCCAGAQPAETPPGASALPVALPRRALRWINPDETGGLAAHGTYTNALGVLGVVNASGAADATGHPFFASLGSNGRACVSCHQPQDGMSLSLDSIHRQWQVTQGQDPIFAAVDGADCPHLPQEQAASHSLLLNRGLFRVFLPWPPRDAKGQAIAPEFTLEVLRDPTGCNTHAQFGLAAPDPKVSVYRRPRPAANLKYAIRQPFNLMADARAASLPAQAADAAATHLERREPLTAAQLAAIVDFERQVYVAQVIDRKAGRLVEPGAPAALGPAALVDGAAGLAADRRHPVFGGPDDWATTPDTPARAAIVRGQQLFAARRFRHAGASESCASCHDMRLTGLNTRTGWINAGTTTQDAIAELPLFRLTCKASRRVVLTQDPGRALISGQCRDIGAIVLQPLRGLASRPPYFASGSAATLREVIDLHAARYNGHYSEQEKADLASFLGVL